jgi:chromate reductase
MSDTPLRILAVCGSLRRASYNRALLRTAIELAPPTLTFIQHEIGDIPLYNGDVEAEGFPPPVVAFREAIRAADGLLFVTPEYNHGIPGVLKNAIDWASRPPDMPFRRKPGGLMGASDGPIGTARCQATLRQTMQTLGIRTMVHGEVLVTFAPQKFTEDLQLTDGDTRKHVARYLASYAQWVARMRD